MTKSVDKPAKPKETLTSSQRGRSAKVVSNRSKSPTTRVQSGNRLERTFSPTPQNKKQTSSVC